MGCVVLAILAVGITLGVTLGGGNAARNAGTRSQVDNDPPASDENVLASPPSMGLRPSGPDLPPVDPGFAEAVTAEGDRNASQPVELFGGQIRACWTVAGTLQRLRVGLGSSGGLIDADGTKRAGCVFAPQRAGATQLQVEFLGAGAWTVRLDEQGRTSTPTLYQQLPAAGEVACPGDSIVAEFEA